MRYLIDGFNLFHALGMGPRPAADEPPTEEDLDRFLSMLATLLGPELTPRTTVVFDARERPLWTPSRTSRYGLTVINAIHDPDADACIIRMIREDSGPSSLVVVSSDRQIIQAARRRRARSVSSEEFLRWLAQRRDHRRQPPKEDDKPILPLTAAERSYWLQVFRDAPREIRTDSAPRKRRIRYRLRPKGQQGRRGGPSR